MKLLFGVLPMTSILLRTHTKPIHLLQEIVVRAIAFQNFTSPSSPFFSDLKIHKLYDFEDDSGKSLM